MPSEVVRLIEQYRLQVDAFDQGAMVRMAATWADATRGLEAEYLALAQEWFDRVSQGLPVSEWHLQRLQRYQALLQQIAAKERELAPLLTGQMETAQETLARLGLAHSQEALDFLAPGIVGQFDRLPYSAVANMVGNTGAGTPLGRLLHASWADNAGRVGNALVRGVALGWHPTKTAMAMRDAANVNLSRAIVIARQETLRVYRVASTDQYRASGMIDGWIWKCALSDRTCAACLAMDGTFHPVSEDFGSHVQCRCSQLPHVKDAPMPTHELGEQWLARQNEETQLEVLGPGRLAAYRAGVPLERFATVSHDRTWGDSVNLTPIGDLGYN